MTPDTIAAIVTAAASVAIAIGVPVSLRRNNSDARTRFYAELDRTYFEILKLVIERPYLAHPGACAGDQVIEYDRFAYITWNFVEAIFDYGAEDKHLLDTWKCVFTHEANAHRAWMLKDGNHEKFKGRFLDCLESGEMCSPFKFEDR